MLLSITTPTPASLQKLCFFLTPPLSSCVPPMTSWAHFLHMLCLLVIYVTLFFLRSWYFKDVPCVVVFGVEPYAAFTWSTSEGPQGTPRLGVLGVVSSSIFRIEILSKAGAGAPGQWLFFPGDPNQVLGQLGGGREPMDMLRKCQRPFRTHPILPKSQWTSMLWPVPPPPAVSDKAAWGDPHEPHL